MNYEELSFFNQQLAGMLGAGLPLEGALRQVASGMRDGQLKRETALLGHDLEQGIPLEQAIARRQFPDLYKSMVRVGLKSNNLPAVLTLLADHYRGLDNTWTRLKGLLVYPAIVLATSLVVSALLAALFIHINRETFAAFGGIMPNQHGPPGSLLLFQTCLPVVLLGLIAAVAAVALSVRSVRSWLQWRVPAFREASLAQLASVLALMTEHGCDAGAAFELAEHSEQDAFAKAELGTWRSRLAAGSFRFVDVAKGKLVPPLFVWLVASAGENWAVGFRRAAEVYGARAAYRIELALYAVLPLTILFLTLIVATELAPILATFGRFMATLGDLGGDF